MAMLHDDSKNLQPQYPLCFGRSQRSNRGNLNIKEIAHESAKKHFGKCYEIEGEYLLPEADTMFTEPAWVIDELQTLKIELNSIRSKLNNYDLEDWHDHSRARHKGGKVYWYLKRIVNAEFLTQAWAKFWEMASRFPLISEKVVESEKLRSVHLAEAPGAFVCALNHWLKNKNPTVDWKWLATTLNPYYEGTPHKMMIADDRFLRHTVENWYFGADNTGNIMSLENVDSLVEETKSDCINLVTADGSVDCFDVAEEQELEVSHLHYCETVTALHVLAKDGNFLLKIFTLFEYRTVCLLYLLACTFKKVIINKPAMSKEGNSEVYIICLSYKGKECLDEYMSKLRSNHENLSTNAMFRLKDINEEFVKQLIECSRLMSSHQCETILENIRTFGNYNDRDDLNNRTKQHVLNYFLKNCGIAPLTQSQKLLCDKILPPRQKISHLQGLATSYESRKKEKDLDPRKRFAMYAWALEHSQSVRAEEKIKLEMIPDEIVISTGKEYKKFESSKFCSNEALDMFNEVLDHKQEFGFEGNLPPSSDVEEFITKLVSTGDKNQKVLAFEYTNKPKLYELIKSIYDTLKTREENQDLILLGYSMLSQVSVGLAYIFSRTFESVEFEPNEKLGYIINCKGYKQTEEVMKIFVKILDAWEEAKKIGHVVLSILPIISLSESKQHESIELINHRILKYCVHKIVLKDETCYSNYLDIKNEKSKQADH